MKIIGHNIYQETITDKSNGIITVIYNEPLLKVFVSYQSSIENPPQIKDSFSIEKPFTIDSFEVFINHMREMYEEKAVLVD